ncbi:CDP-diacylglycerol-inositol 3-phosphatidyltransferase [Crotalus adamanteus]|uniref:CDP-diacylglycerol-inositol 3-phosphatidyltransferase n=1 Tax=Crotalus adamanteus TaxID=8729 RepID=A0AAW1B1R5_CROAD
MRASGAGRGRIGTPVAAGGRLGGVRWVSPDLSLALDLGLRLVLQGISDLRRATAVSKMKQENIFLFVPNLIVASLMPLMVMLPGLLTKEPALGPCWTC